MHSVIFFDFDGVILNSNEIRTNGFREVLKEFPKDKVEELIVYHQANGGLSRYVKFKYFFEVILKTSVTEKQVLDLAKAFSVSVYAKLKNPELLLERTLSFIKNNFKAYKFFIVSGSDGFELRNLCYELNIDQFFLRIEGSPIEKTILVKYLINSYNLNLSDCILVGDSINDYNAAVDNEIDFMGIGHPELIMKSNFLLF